MLNFNKCGFSTDCFEVVIRISRKKTICGETLSIKYILTLFYGNNLNFTFTNDNFSYRLTLLMKCIAFLQNK